jgi:predicted O-methyltransferase YrrM
MAPDEFAALVKAVTDDFLAKMPLVGQVDEFLAETLIGDDPALDQALAANEAAGLVPFDVAANQGKLLGLLVRASRASEILEIGTLGGYSTIWLARALPSDGHVVTIECDRQHADVARQNLDRAGLGDRVDIKIGLALEILPALHSLGGPKFDFVFIDADKENDVAYTEWAIELCRPGALIVVDNVIRFGGILNPDAAALDPGSRGSRQLLEFIGSHPRLDGTALQTVGLKGWDGFAIASVTG